MNWFNKWECSEGIVIKFEWENDTNKLRVYSTGLLECMDFASYKVAYDHSWEEAWALTPYASGIVRREIIPDCQSDSCLLEECRGGRRDTLASQLSPASIMISFIQSIIS